MPVISFSGNAGTYDASATINITCSATDALSGVYTQNCPNIQGPAYAFGVQTSTFAGTATDKAGNVGSGTVTFTVVVTPAGLKALVDRFVSSAAIANSLDRKLDRVAAAIASGDEQLKAGVVGAFIDEVNAIRGIKISEGDADILVYLAGFL